jgi:hypothetical protein
MSLRVLITNNVLTGRTGTELYVRDLALGLMARGDTPLVYSPALGEIADALGQAGVEVVSNPGKLSVTPDVIHGHHEIPTMTALLHFAGVPGIFMCHDRRHHSDIPPTFPRILRYIAVDNYCRERFAEHSIPDARVRVIFNGVDLKRFKPRGPLPDRPQRALVFSNNASERTHLPVVRDACARAGLSLDVIGSGSGNPCARPEAVLGQYDLVFAKGRCAVEAVAVGTAVILCDALVAGPLVTSRNLDALRHFNSSTKHLWQQPLRSELVLQEIGCYDARDVAEVSRRVRGWVDLRTVVDQLVAVYREVLTEHAQGSWSRQEEVRAAAAYRRRSRSRRFRERIKRVPVVGGLALALKQKIAPYRPEL